MKTQEKQRGELNCIQEVRSLSFSCTS